MISDINPGSVTMVDLVQDFGDRLLNLYIRFDRGVGFHDASDLLDWLLDALVAQTEHVQGLAFTAGRVTVQDVAAERLLDEVAGKLLRDCRHYTELAIFGDSDDGNVLRTLLADVFDVSIACVISGGAR